MEDSRPLGYSQRQKRSHAQMEEQERSSPSAWSSSLLNATQHSRTCPNYRQQTPWESIYSQPSRSDVPTSTGTERPASASAGHSGRSHLQLPRIENMASSAPQRYAGDGFDYRRPAGGRRVREPTPVDLSGDDEFDNEEDMPIDLSRDSGVIDLTADDSGYGPSQDDNEEGQSGSNGQGQSRSNSSRRTQRNLRPIPRGMDIIIDLDNGDEVWRPSPADDAEPGSPEIEFISSRAIPPTAQPTFGRSNSEGDDVEFVRAQPLPEDEVRRRTMREMDRAIDLMNMNDLSDRFVHLRGRVEHFRNQVSRTAASLRRTPQPPPRGPARGMVQGVFVAPGFFEYDRVGFDLGLEPDRPPMQAAPTYKAPDKAPEGFTRSPQEEDNLVCPNCGDELCVGDDDVKRQVWIVKLCGHVYCGECTSHRSIKKSSKGKERTSRTRPFKECVVENCDKKVTNAKSMFQIFL